MVSRLVPAYAVCLLLAIGPARIGHADDGPAPRDVTTVTLKFSLPEHDLFPESIAHDPVTGCFFLGSMSSSRILRIRPDGTYENLLAEGETGLPGSVGLKVDAERRFLWVCSGRFTLHADYDSTPARTGVFQFDLDDGSLIRKWELDQESDYHIFNDLAVADGGEVYVTTTLLGRVYRVSAGQDEMELLLQLPDGSHNNGITLGPRERFLFLTVDRGISRFDLETGELMELPTPAGEGQGSDGIYFHDGDLIVVKPRLDQVVRLGLNEEFSAVVEAEVLVADHPEFAFPTTGVLVDDRLALVATSFANVPRREDRTEQHPDVRILEIGLGGTGE